MKTLKAALLLPVVLVALIIAYVCSGDLFGDLADLWRGLKSGR